MVSNIFYFYPYLGKIPILTNIFQRGWNHQLVTYRTDFFPWFFGTTFEFLEDVCVSPSAWSLLGSQELEDFPVSELKKTATTSVGSPVKETVDSMPISHAIWVVVERRKWWFVCHCISYWKWWFSNLMLVFTGVDVKNDIPRYPMYIYI